jgi:glycogen synthase
MQERAMYKSFSWEDSADRYEAAYEKALEIKKSKDKMNQ